MPRPKHRKDGNRGKQGWIGGNPRYGKSRRKDSGLRPDLSRNQDKENFRRGIDN